MALKKDWTVYLIHHAHTDIGYTERLLFSVLQNNFETGMVYTSK